jgi:hypothetical protein
MRDAESSATIYNARSNEAIHAKHMSWALPEHPANLDATDAEVEVWHEMRGGCSWRCGVVSCANGGYRISNRGRLKNSKGDVTSGFYFDGRR